MNTAKVEVALGGHVGNVGGDFALLAQLPDNGRCIGIVDGDQHHVGSVEILGLENSIDVDDLFLGNAEGYFIIETGLGADDDDFGVGIEAVEDPACGDLQ